MDQDSLLLRVFTLIPLVLSLSVHEWAHAAAAVSLGDDTPIRQGRFTLNPIAHVDPIGTLILPLLGIPFGWAKPVEWNPSRVRRDVPMQRALWLVSIAGPASNVVLALLAAIGLMFVTSVSGPTFIILRLFFQMNVSLAVFNMLPIPPLDGSRIVDANIPRSLADVWGTVHRIAPLLLIGVIMIPPVRELVGTMIQFVAELLLQIAYRITGR